MVPVCAIPTCSAAAQSLLTQSIPLVTVKPTPAWGRGLQEVTVTELPWHLRYASVLLLLPQAEHGQIKQQQRVQQLNVKLTELAESCSVLQDKKDLSCHRLWDSQCLITLICFSHSSEQKQPLTYLTHSVGWRGGGFTQNFFSICKNPMNKEFQRLLWLPTPRVVTEPPNSPEWQVRLKKKLNSFLHYLKLLIIKVFCLLAFYLKNYS